MFSSLVSDRKKQFRWVMRQFERNGLPLDEVLQKDFVDSLNSHDKAMCHMAIKHFATDKIPLAQWRYWRQIKSISFGSSVVWTLMMFFLTLVFHEMRKIYDWT